MRIILYTGKGGVGKTTIAAATAVLCASMGHKTLVMSTDAAHSLADSLDLEIGTSVQQIGPKLYAQEIDVHQELKENWGTIQSFLVKFLKSQGFEEVIAEEFAIVPGMEELFCLLKLKEYYDNNQFDVAIIDCAPTASTIRMLSFPDIIQWYMERFFHLERKIVKTIRPMAERITKIPFPTDDVFLSVEDLYKKILGMKDILTDARTSTIRLVLNPEKMVIKESQRAYTYLNLFDFTVDAVIVNRLFPEDNDNSYIGKWREIQKKYLLEAENSFPSLPLLPAKLFDRELVGIPQLTELARHLFKDQDPSRVFHSTKPISIFQQDGCYCLNIDLPHADKKDVQIWVKGEELIIKVKQHQRNIILPHMLASLELDKARFENGKCHITFRGEK